MSSWHNKLVRVLDGLDYLGVAFIPEVLVSLIETARDPKSTLRDLAEICRREKSCNSRLIRAANAVALRSREGGRVARVEEAVARLGVDAAREIAAAAVVANLFKSNKVLNDYSSNELWRHSMSVAVANRLVYSVYFKRSSVEAFIAGLVHDFGISVEHQFLYHDGFEAAILERQKNGSLLVDEERRHLGITHEELGKAIGSHWGMPDRLLAVVGHHHESPSGNTEADCLVHVTRVSELMSHALGYGFSDFPESHLDTLYPSVERLGLDDASVVLLAEQLKKEMDNLDYHGWFSSLKVRRIA